MIIIQLLRSIFQKHIEAYEAEGIPIWGITPENEPEMIQIGKPTF